MMDCKQATRLMSQAQDRTLTFRERVNLKLHLLLCTGCKNYNKQMDFIRKTIQQFRQR